MMMQINTGRCVGITLVLVLALSGVAVAQSGAFGEQFVHASLVGVGNCDAVYYGRSFSLARNPAHTAVGEKWGFDAGYRRMYGLSEFDRVSAAAKVVLSQSGVGISVSRFGKADFYTEFESSVHAAVRIKSRLALGVTAAVHRLAYTPNLPAYTGWSASVGALYAPRKDLIISAAIHRLVRTDFVPRYSLPRYYQASAAYSVPDVIQIGTSWSKHEHNRDLVGFGQRVHLAENFRFLSALYFDPVRYALGVEFTVYGQFLTYTYLSHQDLDGTHYMSYGIGNW